MKFAFPDLHKAEKSVPLSCLGPGLYGWDGDGEFTTWLAEHPYTESIAVVDAFFLKELGYKAGQDINLAALVDDIRGEEVYGVTVDGTRLSNIDTL